MIGERAMPLSRHTHSTLGAVFALAVLIASATAGPTCVLHLSLDGQDSLRAVDGRAVGGAWNSTIKAVTG